MKAVHKSSARIVWVGALIVLLLLLGYKAGTEGLSNFYAQTAQLEIARWSKPGQRFTGDETARVLRYLAQSLDYAPKNPWPLEVMGTMQLRSMSAATDPQLAVAAARSANADFRMALAQRPTSPFSWANFALSKLYLDEKDEALVRALGRAEALGPWEPEVQQAVVFVGLAVWDRLDAAQRATVVRAMQRGAQRDPTRIAEIAKSFNRVDLFCGLSYIGSKGRGVCRQASKSG